MSEIERKDTVDRFEFQPKETVLTMRLSGFLLDKIKEQAKAKYINYQKFIRMILEQKIKKEFK